MKSIVFVYYSITLFDGIRQNLVKVGQFLRALTGLFKIPVIE